ncbi:hypothetical protein [Colwellia sp. RSH04]|uniref:hypothetical protein n=1 Tax=Colwellia sp. RSH04 TaxID=2305464 RepID=UPI0015F8CC37|nr:hypothetical protein [Colwellia sp. RSH04]
MPEDMDIWFQDEARFGQQNQTTRVWVERGTRPRVVKQQKYDYGYWGSLLALRLIRLSSS